MILIRNELSYGSVLALAVAVSLSGFAGEQRLNLDPPKKGGRFPAPTDLVWPAQAGEADVCLWADDRMAALSITIDDNCRPDHAWWLERAKELDLPLTWFVITDKVDGPNAGFCGKWTDWQALAAAGHSIQSHSTNHDSDHNQKRPLREDELVPMYANSQKIIDEKLTSQKCLTLAYPRGECKRDVAKRYYIAARGTSGVPNAANAIDYMNTGLGSVDRGSIEIVLDGRTEYGPKWLRGKAYLKRGWVVALYHLVGTGKTEAEKAKGREKAAEGLKYLATRRKELWCDTFVNVAKYGQERDTAKLVVESSDAHRIVYTLTDEMKDDVFDYPLTVKVRLPAGWTTVKATQGGKAVEAKLVEHDGATYALVKSVPDRGPTEVSGK